MRIGRRRLALLGLACSFLCLFLLRPLFAFYFFVGVESSVERGAWVGRSAAPAARSFLLSLPPTPRFLRGLLPSELRNCACMWRHMTTSQREQRGPEGRFIDDVNASTLSYLGALQSNTTQSTPYGRTSIVVLTGRRSSDVI